MSFMNMFLKFCTLSVAWSATYCPTTSVLEKDYIVHLGAIIQCEGVGVEGHTWDSTHAFYVKSTSEG